MEQVKPFEISSLLKEKVVEELSRQLESTSMQDIHQAIITVCYMEYNTYLAKANKILEEKGSSPMRWYYSNFLEWVRDQLGDLAEFAILIDKYNQQIFNGGHLQYWSNEYSSMNGQYKDLYLHMNMIEYFETFMKDIDSLYPADQILQIKETLEEARKIMREFPESIEWITNIHYAGFDYYGDLCYNDPDKDCRTLTEHSSRKLDYLDSQYYKINNRLMDILNLYFKNYLFEKEA